MTEATELFQRLIHRLHRELTQVWETQPWKGQFFTQAVRRALIASKADVASTSCVPADALRCFHCEDGGEYMLDFCWTTYPVRFTPETGPNSPANPYEIVLAVETEQGVEKDKSRNYAEVMDDFCKLIDVKARLKVLVYRCHQRGRTPVAGDYVQAFENVLAHHRHPSKDERWLFVGVPWLESQLTLLSHELRWSRGRPALVAIS